MTSHLRATRRHLPYGITQCYLPSDASELAPPNPSQIYLLRRDGTWKAESTYHVHYLLSIVNGYVKKGILLYIIVPESALAKSPLVTAVDDNVTQN